MKHIDDIKTISIDEKTYEAAKTGMRSPTTVERTCIVTCNDQILMVTELDPFNRLDPEERTLFSRLLGKAQIGSRPFDLSQA